ncbi:hypothetical protein Ancab_038038 [Ancistrocladus abbreviatus]
MLDGGGTYSPVEATGEAFACINSVTVSKKRKMKNKKRFSDEQIRSLESIFQNESKLEPRKKVQLAKELGLQPRQVAIWFQNKRARWKSKQIERDYSILRANYNALASRYENLKKEKQTLVIQLQKLSNTVGKTESEGRCCKAAGAAGTSIDHPVVNEDDKKNESEELNPSSLPLEGSEYGAAILSDDGCSKSTNYFEMEQDTDLLTMVEPACSSLTSDEDWQDLHSDDLFNRSPSSCQWWDFWS